MFQGPSLQPYSVTPWGLLAWPMGSAYPPQAMPWLGGGLYNPAALYGMGWPGMAPPAGGLMSGPPFGG